MVVVHVKHYLNNNGILFFNEWFINISKILKSQDGFISIGYGQDKKNISCMSVLLKFENEEKLSIWGKSRLHDLEVSKLDPYRIRPYEATRINLINIIKNEN
ncbi:MAG: hypothetical protein QM752_02515 [Gammaproteobacteria bacterium]